MKTNIQALTDSLHYFMREWRFACKEKRFSHAWELERSIRDSADKLGVKVEFHPTIKILGDLKIH